MDMHSKNQYLTEVRAVYLKEKTKKGRSALLNEAQERTKLKRKYLIKKLRPKSNLDKKKEPRKKRSEYYDSYDQVALIECWKIFDRACGQRLAPLLRDEVDRLRRDKELTCTDATAMKLKKMSFRTIDEKLIKEKEIERLNQKYPHKNNPLLYSKIPVKLSDEWDRNIVGNIQIDMVEHCGQSAAGEFINTLSNTDISTGWWEGEAVIGRGQFRTQEALDLARKRFPFDFKEIHSDNGSEFINSHLFNYTQKEKLNFSRSRPSKKNDNCFVEQKNWTHVRKLVGYLRYETEEELRLINDLYCNELRLYKNFFQPVMKLVSKERIGGRIKRKYDLAATPYKRVMTSTKTTQAMKDKLTALYDSLNPAELKRTIEKKQALLYSEYEKRKNKIDKIDWEPIKQISIFNKRLKPATVSNYIADREVVSVS